MWNNLESSKSEKIEIVPRGTILFIIIFLGLLQSTIGIIQFLTQKSIGLFWLKESLISPETLGVAKITLNGEKFIRSYGLMPHPNILGGFLLFSIIITLLYKKLFHACLPDRQVEQSQDKYTNIDLSYSDNALNTNNHQYNQDKLHIVPRGTICNLILSIYKNCSTPACRTGRWKNLNINFILKVLLTIQIIALFLTFSKSAIISLFIAFIYTNFPRLKNKYKNCSTWNIMSYNNNCKNLKKEIVPRGTFKIYALISSISIILIFLLAKPDLNSIFIKSLNERISFLIVPRGTISQNPILGIGSGQSVLSMQKFYPRTLEFWEYQPTHNVFLLIWSELGIIGLILFIWWIWNIFHPLNLKIVPRGTITKNKTKSEQIALNNNNFTSNTSKIPIPEEDTSILNNNNILLSNDIYLLYFKGIFLGFLFIMLFDHYLWDIQQGSLLFWLTAGFVAGINKK